MLCCEECPATDVHSVLRCVIRKGKRVMSLDLGEKKIGTAFSDRTNLIATPHSVYYRHNMSKDIGFLNRLFKEGDAGSMVVGLPVELKEGDQSVAQNSTELR